MHISNLARLAAVLVVAASTAVARPVLDPDFGNDGFRLVSGVGNTQTAIGSCPTENGSLAVVGYDLGTSQFVILRLRPDGALDASFSGDGVAYLPAPANLDPTNTVMSCQGVANGNASDDSIAVAIVENRAGTEPDFTRLAWFDLSTGEFSSGYAGQASRFELSTAVTASPALHNTRLGSVSRLPSGEWLLVGQLRNATQLPTRRAFVVRFNAAMTSAVLTGAPNRSGTDVEHIAVVRIGGDGRLHALAHGVSDGIRSLLHLRLFADTLLLDTVAAFPRTTGFSYELHRGRTMGGGRMVAAGTRLASFGGTQPFLVIARDAGIQEITLPQPAPFGGLGAGIVSEGTGTPTATSALGDRAIYVANVDTEQGPYGGYYVAAVQLGDGAGVPDDIDLRFATQGSATFRYTTQNGNCWNAQRLGNISSWGATTAMVGSASPGCDSGTRQPLISRIDSDSNSILKDSFE
ncbi:MAG TPA: hypothetical protein VN581_01880 [Patescibacteria group bacterium]|nr:hypothetical protein [Patescibacteria group bacterium]